MAPQLTGGRMRQGRAVVLVDVSFLIKALLIQVGQHRRDEVAINWTALADAIGVLAEEETGAVVLRQTWYDAARGSRPRQEHRTLASIPGVHVQLGWVVETSRGPQQKAVDTTIVRDLVVTASRGSVDEVVLIAGDGDLVPGVREAVDRGLRVHLWGVSLDDARVRQSEELVALADRRLAIDIADFASHVRLIGDVPPLGEGADEMAEPALAGPAEGLSPQEGAAGAGSSGESMDELEAVKHVLSPPARTPSEQARLGPPSLRQLTSADQRLLDSYDDEETFHSTDQIGASYGERWWSRADEATRERLQHVARKPSLPRLIDGDLLKYGSRLGINTQDKQARHNLRSGFWSAVDDHRARSRTSGG